MSNKTEDDKGYSWQRYNPNSGTSQQNSKTWEGEHTWYDPNTLKSGWHGSKTSDEDKKFLGRTKK